MEVASQSEHVRLRTYAMKGKVYSMQDIFLLSRDILCQPARSEAIINTLCRVRICILNSDLKSLNSLNYMVPRLLSPTAPLTARLLLSSSSLASPSFSA